MHTFSINRPVSHNVDIHCTEKLVIFRIFKMKLRFYMGDSMYGAFRWWWAIWTNLIMQYYHGVSMVRKKKKRHGEYSQKQLRKYFWNNSEIFPEIFFFFHSWSFMSLCSYELHFEGQIILLSGLFWTTNQNRRSLLIWP